MGFEEVDIEDARLKRKRPNQNQKTATVSPLTAANNGGNHPSEDPQSSDPNGSFYYESGQNTPALGSTKGKSLSPRRKSILAGNAKNMFAFGLDSPGVSIQRGGSSDNLLTPQPRFSQNKAQNEAEYSYRDSDAESSTYKPDQLHKGPIQFDFNDKASNVDSFKLNEGEFEDLHSLDSSNRLQSVGDRKASSPTPFSIFKGRKGSLNKQPGTTKDTLQLDSLDASGEQKRKFSTLVVSNFSNQRKTSLQIPNNTTSLGDNVLG